PSGLPLPRRRAGRLPHRLRALGRVRRPRRPALPARDLGPRSGRALGRDDRAHRLDLPAHDAREPPPPPGRRSGLYRRLHRPPPDADPLSRRPHPHRSIRSGRLRARAQRRRLHGRLAAPEEGAMSEPPGAVADDRSHRWWLLALLGFSFLCRAALGSFYFGFHTGDDVEILEFGFHRALGLAYTPWAIRNTLLSDVLVAPVVWLAHAAGTESIRRLCWFATAPFVLLSVLNIKMLHALVLRWFRDPVLSLAAAAAYALHWIPMGYGSTVYPRTASTACVLASVLLLARERTSWLRYAVAGFLLSIGFAFRYSEGIYLVPVLILLAWRGEEPRLRGIALVCSGFALGVLVFCGGYDLLLWGRAFSSLRAFWTYTLVERASSSLSAVQPPYWYLWRSLRWISP